MPRILLGFFYAVLASIAFSLLFSLAICCGAYPESRSVSDAAAPLLGIFAGAYLASRTPSWKTGAWIGLIHVVAWFEFWMYAMGRFNPLLWLEEGVAHLSPTHLFWWATAVFIGAVGSSARRFGFHTFFALLILVFLGLVILMQFVGSPPKPLPNSSIGAIPGFKVERVAPGADQTTVYLLTYDFTQQSHFLVGLYDCDSDDAQPYDDANTTYMGQSLDGLVDKLDYQAQASHRRLLGVINGGFFGASGFSVAHHEEPIVQGGRVLYDVDLLRPKDQAWFFAVNSPMSVMAGNPRFSMLPSIPLEKRGDYQTVLGGVRPLRIGGNSVPLQPGAGATTLKCSRTSVGWSADGDKFYVLVEYDPDSEGASQFRRKMHWPHPGGWDVCDVQKFWEEKAFPLRFSSTAENRPSSPIANPTALSTSCPPVTNTALPSAISSSAPSSSPCRSCRRARRIAASSIISTSTGLNLRSRFPSD